MKVNTVQFKDANQYDVAILNRMVAEYGNMIKEQQRKMIDAFNIHTQEVHRNQLNNLVGRRNLVASFIANGGHATVERGYEYESNDEATQIFFDIKMYNNIQQKVEL
jgi:hypothetical protein